MSKPRFRLREKMKCLHTFPCGGGCHSNRFEPILVLQSARAMKCNTAENRVLNDKNISYVNANTICDTIAD